MFPYTVEGDEVSLGEPQNITLTVSISDVNTKIAELNMMAKDNISGEIVLHNRLTDTRIDHVVYETISQYLCAANGIEKHSEFAADEPTRIAMIEEARDNLEYQKIKHYEPHLAELVLSMACSSGFKADYFKAMDYPMSVFMNHVRKIQQIKSYDNTMHGVYAGMANVGDQIDNATTASSYLISAMQGFGLVADDAERLLDCMNQIANTEPVSMNDLGIIMQKSSAAMSAAGNTYQETLSLAAAVNGVLQDSEASGTYLKTLSMYLRASKTDAENAGIATDGMASSVSELRSELKQLAGVDIMKDDNTFKSTYQIMKELSEVWKDLSDTTQANITELIAGKRGGQSTSALLNNFSVAEDAMKQALNSSGSAMRENQTYMDSLQAKLNQLDSAFQKFSTDLMKSDIPKFFVDLATVFVDGADNAVKFAGALPTLTAAISGVLSVMQMSGKLKNGAGKVNMPSYICCV